MKKKAAEKIIGMEIDLWSSGGKFYASARTGDVIVVEDYGNTKEEALNRLVQANYARVCEIVAKRQSFRCANCSSLSPLQFHHIVHRSKGRVDSIDNIIGLCSRCHHEEHWNGPNRNRANRAHTEQEEQVLNQDRQERDL